MGGELKRRKRITVSINSDYESVFKDLSEITRIPQSKLMDEALNDLFVKHEGVLKTAYTQSIKNEIAHQKNQAKILGDKKL